MIHPTNITIARKEYPALTISEEMKRKPIDGTEDIYNLVKDFADQKNEYALIIALNEKDEIVSVKIVSIGGREEATLSIPDIMKSAMLDDACNIIFVHNHPNGCLEPSANDEEFVKGLKEAAEALEIGVVDSIIIAEGKFQSMFAEKNPVKAAAKGSKKYVVPVLKGLDTVSQAMKPFGICMIAIEVMIIAAGGPGSDLAWTCLIYPLAWFGSAITNSTLKIVEDYL